MEPLTLNLAFNYKDGKWTLFFFLVLAAIAKLLLINKFDVSTFIIYLAAMVIGILILQGMEIKYKFSPFITLESESIEVKQRYFRKSEIIPYAKFKSIKINEGNIVIITNSNENITIHYFTLTNKQKKEVLPRFIDFIKSKKDEYSL